MAETLTPDRNDASPGSLIDRDGQIQWAGLLLGPGTPYAIDRQGLTGWEDLPEADSTDADRPTGHGAWTGAQYARPRRVAGTLWLLPGPGADPLDTLRTLRRALALQDREQWLAVRMHGETLLVRARVVQRVIPADRQLLTGGPVRAAVQWLAADPRRYESAEQSARTGPPQPETGLVWPLTWPLDWGQPAVTGDVPADNDGSAPTQPLIVFHGPCGNPTVTERSTGRRLRYLIDLGPDDELVVDTAAGTVTLNGTASRRHTAAPDSSPEELFAFAPGRSELAFRPDRSGPGATVTARWRSAEW
ncbi:phage distal tail protein [Streptomyces sp. NPDC048604]|uniref:phage distal tail protein n=1 Tax=Streptomyces sp. NPDC048604 TaxID=3365578 RepID=UPI00371F21BF